MAQNAKRLARHGQRFLGSGTFLWYRDIARILREGLPDDAAKVPTRAMPDIIVKLLALLNPQMAMLRPELGRIRLVDSGKARTQLGWHPRPTEQTIIDTANAIIAESRLQRLERVRCASGMGNGGDSVESDSDDRSESDGKAASRVSDGG